MLNAGSRPPIVGSTRKVMLTVAPAGVADTTPPAPWWVLALRRLWVQVAPLLPVLIDELISLYQQGEITVPHAWVPVVSVLIILIQTAAKAAKEQQNAEAARQLQQQGVPVGTVYHPVVARDLLEPVTAPPERTD